MQSIKRFLLTILLFLTATALEAQTSHAINGHLVDEQRQLLPYATVVLKTPDSINYRSTQSDDKGKFRVHRLAAGNYRLEISMVGFERLVKFIQLKNSDIDLGELMLKSSVNQLNSVTIKGDVQLVDRQTDKTVINVARNINNDGSTVLEVMKKLPGVQITPDGQITMNGKPGVNILIDGKPTYLSADDLNSLLNGMPASIIQKIELMSNPSSKYDAAGTAGIINIVKKKNQKEGFNGMVNGSYVQGYYGRYNGGFSLSYKNGHYNLFVNNTYSYSHDFSGRSVTSDISDVGGNLLSEQVSGNNGSSINKNYRPTIGLDIYLSKRSTLTLSGTLGTGSANSQLLSDMDVRDSMRNKTSHIGFTSRLKDSPFNYTAGMQFVHQLDTAGRSINIDVDHSEYRNFPLQYNFNTLENVNNNIISETNELLKQHRQLDIYGAKVDYTQPLRNNGSFEAGLKSSYVKANNNNTYYDQIGGQSIPDPLQSDYTVNSENINAAYVNLNQSYSKLTLQAGLRAEQTITKGNDRQSGTSINQNYLQLFPTLFLNEKLNEQNTLILRLGRRTERPDYHELVPFRRPQTATLFFQGNPDLRPQTSWHGELSWSWQSTIIITLNYDIYKDYIRTLPFLDSDQTTLTRRPINIQGAHAWDIDIVYTKKLTNWWATDNTISVYQNAFTGQTRGYILNNSGLASVDVTANNSFQLSEFLMAECDFEYSSKRQYVTSTFGAYSGLSIGIKLQLLGKKASLSLNANNILQSEAHYGIDRNLGLYQYSYFKDYSRYISLNFSCRFGSGKTSKVHIESGSSDVQKRAGN
ncbi:Outer membrane receptor proteins, mostly Fe transport [Mucilaginibacter sp. OK268]|uniref:outer membrane beta-barrel family protein n=1 Tax=Mucilaginibacter sp. OK268 TaxID=1881048 RepID=UPI00088DF8D4|nr:outer membrane beta-barrel family protein [Mucilaginibacter sp. OK268]SDP73162.1 Outer membrane receptor proteins, mostly Fe transport [Mucilaginibacter sp. OK268]